MATQFYKSPAEWEQIKIQQSQLAQQKISQYSMESSMNIDDIKRLAGINQNNLDQSIEQQSIDRNTRMRFIQENNINPGTPRWFKVMYSRPELTGEDPFGE